MDLTVMTDFNTKDYIIYSDETNKMVRFERIENVKGFLYQLEQLVENLNISDVTQEVR